MHLETTVALCSCMSGNQKCRTTSCRVTAASELRPPEMELSTHKTTRHRLVTASVGTSDNTVKHSEFGVISDASQNSPLDGATSDDRLLKLSRSKAVFSVYHKSGK